MAISGEEVILAQAREGNVPGFRRTSARLCVYCKHSPLAAGMWACKKHGILFGFTATSEELITTAGQMAGFVCDDFEEIAEGKEGA